MKTVRLGKTELKVSKIGMGGIPITRPTEEEAIRVIQRALDLGINFIDTSLAYGDSEIRIGKAIADRRDEVIVTTKGRTSEHIEQSLKHLKTDYIDLWQFHNISTSEDLEKILGSDGTMAGVQEALEEGKIRHIGISSHTLKIAIRAAGSGQFEVVQFPFNFVSNEALDELIPLAHKHDVGFIAMKPFAGGRIRSANLAIKYLLQFDNVVPDPGIEKIEEIEEIVDIVNNRSWELSSQEKQEIEDIREKLGTRFCRQCQYCMPSCPQGINISMVMITDIMWREWPHDIFFEWMEEIIEDAKTCIQCGECEEKCPYNLPIREMIKENIEFYENVKQKYNKMEGKSS